MATGDREWAGLAGNYLAIGFTVLDEMYETAQVGKVGWGAALTYAVTGARKYLNLAERVGDALIAQQTDAGAWDNTGGFATQAVRTEVTCVFIVLLDEMIGGLPRSDQRRLLVKAPEADAVEFARRYYAG
jgi:hypothetical protein